MIMHENIKNIWKSMKINQNQWNDDTIKDFQGISLEGNSGAT